MAQKKFNNFILRAVSLIYSDTFLHLIQYKFTKYKIIFIYQYF